MLLHYVANLQSNPNRAKSEMPFRRKVIIISHLLRFLAPHPNISALQGASYDYSSQSAGPPTTLPRALLGIVTNESSLPPACLDTTLTALMQLVIGFPAESNDLSSQVPPTHLRLTGARHCSLVRCEAVSCMLLPAVRGSNLSWNAGVTGAAKVPHKRSTCELDTQGASTAG